MKMVLRRWVGSRGLVLLAFWLAAGTARADVGYAYALISGGASPVVSAAYSQNSANGPITVTRNATGSYRVNFSNSGIGTGWTVIATFWRKSDRSSLLDGVLRRERKCSSEHDRQT